MRRARRVKAVGVSSANRRAGVGGTPPAYEQPPTNRTAQWVAMVAFLVLLFPLVLLGFAMFMERVEEPLNQVAVEREMQQFLDDANSEELDTFVREGADSALSRFRQRLGFRWRRRVRSG